MLTLRIPGAPARKQKSPNILESREQKLNLNSQNSSYVTQQSVV